jgi:hypothetical protein
MSAEIVRVKIPSLQDLLTDPEPERVVFGLSVSEDLGPENI